MKMLLKPTVVKRSKCMLVTFLVASQLPFPGRCCPPIVQAADTGTPVPWELKRTDNNDVTNYT